MRKGFVALILGILASACGGGEEAVQPPQPPPPPPVASTPQPAPPVAEAPKPAKPTLGELEDATARAIVAAMNAHDAKKVAALYTDDAAVTVPGMPVQNGEFHGRADVEKSFQPLMDAFKDMKFWFSRVWVKGDMAAFEWGWTGTQTGELYGMKASEKPAGEMGVSVVWFDQDGHVKKENRYSDGVTLFTQVGAGKGKARAIPVPAAAPEVHMSKGTPEEDKNMEVVKQLDGSFDSKKEADFLASLADDVEYNDMAQPEATKGKAEAKKFFAMFTKAFPDAKSTPGAMFATGDFVINESTIAGTQKGPMGPLPASKKPVTMHSVDISLIKDGKIVKGWSYSNNAEMLMQIGALKMPGAAAAKAADKPAAAGAKGDKAAPAAAGGSKAGGGNGAGPGTGGGGGAGSGGGAKPATKADAPKK